MAKPGEGGCREAAERLSVPLPRRERCTGRDRQTAGLLKRRSTTQRSKMIKPPPRPSRIPLPPCPIGDELSGGCCLAGVSSCCPWAAPAPGLGTGSPSSSFPRDAALFPGMVRSQQRGPRGGSLSLCKAKGQARAGSGSQGRPGPHDAELTPCAVLRTGLPSRQMHPVSTAASPNI